MAPDTTITVRLDTTTQQYLTELVEHFTAQDTLHRRVNTSDIVRAAISDLHATRIEGDTA